MKRILALIPALLLLLACRPASLETAVSPVNSPLSSILPTPTILPIRTPEPTTPSADGWITYIYTDNVSIEYPSDWFVTPSIYDFVDFVPPAAVVTPTVDNVIRLEVSRLPKEQQSSTNPYSWEGNEGGYIVRWAKPITIENATGLEFVWGESDKWTAMTSINTLYYSEKYELRVGLKIFFDRQSVEMAQALGITDTIASRYNVFERMAQSIRIADK